MQGEKAAPELVKHCIASWRNRNRGWRTIVLDQSNYEQYIEVGISRDDFSLLGIPMRSDLLRLALLERYGGVWADATTLCWRPLDQFIHAYVSASGFFAFSRSQGERILSSWFLAAMPHHPIVRRWRLHLCQYFHAYPPRWQYSSASRICHKFCRELFKLHPLLTLLWLQPAVIRFSGQYPYFLLHYLFASIILSEKEVKELWSLTPKIGNAPCKTLSKIALKSAPSMQKAKEMLDHSSYLFKLSHKSKSLQAAKSGTWLEFVFSCVEEAESGDLV